MTVPNIQLRTLANQENSQNLTNLLAQATANYDTTDSMSLHSSSENLIYSTSSSEDSDVSTPWSNLASIIRGTRNTHNRIPSSNPALCCFKRYDDQTIETLHDLNNLYGPLAFHLACFKSSLRLSQVAKYPLSHCGETLLHTLCQEALREVGFQTLVYIQTEIAAVVSEIRLSHCIRAPKAYCSTPLPKTCKVLLHYLEILREDGTLFFSNSEIRAIMECATKVRADTSLQHEYVSENKTYCPNLFALAYSIAYLHPSVTIMSTNNHPNRENFMLPSATQNALLQDCWRYHLFG